jgi:hypothetical protein
MRVDHPALEGFEPDEPARFHIMLAFLDPERRDLLPPQLRVRLIPQGHIAIGELVQLHDRLPC